MIIVTASFVHPVTVKAGGVMKVLAGHKKQVDNDHSRRIRQELAKAGVTQYGMTKFVTTYLPRVIYGDEHIEAAVYGRFEEGLGLLMFEEGWLIATDHRVIFLDHKPGYTNMDELGYEAVIGVQKTSAGFFSSITLHTKQGNYTLRFANKHCVDKFMRHVEIRRLEKSRHGYLMINSQQVTTPRHDLDHDGLDDRAEEFLRNHDTAVISTLGRDGQVHGALVHYVVGRDNLIYILTKGGTRKAHDIFATGKVALTIFDIDAMSTAQFEGRGDIESDQTVKDWVFGEIVKPRTYGKTAKLPPVTAIDEGSYMVLRITPVTGRYNDYSERKP